MKTTKIRQFARGQDCQIRIPGCNGNPETVVLCHLPGGGIGRKQPDLFAAFGCSDCHDTVDGRRNYYELEKNQIRLYFFEGVIRTQSILLDAGLIKIN